MNHYRPPTFRERLQAKILAAGALLAFWLAERLCRVSHVGETIASVKARPHPVVLVLWHQRLPYLLRVFGRLGAFIMITWDPRLEPPVQISRWVGMKVVRGGSDGGGKEALAELTGRLQREGGCAVLAVDGPSGPVRKAKAGALQLAAATGAEILPVAYASRRHYIVRNKWDQSYFPFPFTEMKVFWGAGYFVKPEDIEDIEAAKGELGRRLNEVTDWADAWAEEERQ